MQFSKLTRALAMTLAISIVVAACGGGEATGTSGIGSIRGTVSDNTGASVANVTIRLTGNAQAARTTTSGADGVYTFADVPSGSYTLAVSPPAGFTTGVVTMSLNVAGGAQANASAFVLYAAAPDACALARPDFGGAATAADRALFAYDATAPLNLKKTLDSTNNGVVFSTISFDSPAGGQATGIMNEPVGRTGLRPGMVVMHASGSPTGPVQGARVAMFEVRTLAQRGAVVIAIDAPYARRGGWSPPVLPPEMRDRPEQIQLMKDLQRAVDVLLAHESVDPARIAASGYSWGGMAAVHFVGIERRLKAAVITAGYGGTVTAATNKVLLPYLATVSCEARNAWLQHMTPIEPIRFIPGASPTALLFQIARYDTAVPLEDAEAAYEAASAPKEVLYYDTGHGLNAQANQDRFSWLSKQIGIDP